MFKNKRFSPFVVIVAQMSLFLAATPFLQAIQSPKSGATSNLTLGNTVWNDTNNNGLKDAGENGIAGVLVNLFIDDGDGVYTGNEQQLPSVTTDTNGNYTFTGLDSGNYIVGLGPENFGSGDVLEDYLSSSGTVGSPTGPYEPAPDPDNNVDNDDNGTVAGNCIVTLPITLGSSSSNTVDIGVYKPGTTPPDSPNPTPKLSLGDTVWNDVDNNGLLDGGESGIAGVDLYLYKDVDANGEYTSADGTSPLAIKTTNSTGNYLFTDLDAGDYLVVIPRAEFNTGGTLVGYTTSTGTAGSPTGPYEPAPDPDNNVNNDDNGSAVVNGSIVSKAVTLALNTEPINDGDTDANSNLTVDFGVYIPVTSPPTTTSKLSLGDTVWNDTNNNGLLDAGETGVAGVDMQLYLDTNADGIYTTADGTTPLSTDTTNSNGKYLFTDLDAGDYIVIIAQAECAANGSLAGYKSSTGINVSPTGPYEPAPDPDNNVNNDDNGSAAVTGCIHSKAITLSADAEPIDDGDTDANSNLTVDFGVYKPARLGDYIWYDINKNGIQDNGETPAANVSVSLCHASNMAILAQTTTDANGNYLFDNLKPDTYCVTIPKLPQGYWLTTQDVGDDAKDSDVNKDTKRSGFYTLAPGDSNLTVDAGLIAWTPPSSTPNPTPTPTPNSTPTNNSGLQGSGDSQSTSKQSVAAELSKTGSPITMPTAIASIILVAAIILQLQKAGYRLQR
jgi:hypothetical protein